MEQTNTEKRLPWYGIPAILPYLKEYRTKMVIMVFLGAVSSVAEARMPMRTSRPRHENRAHPLRLKWLNVSTRC